MAYIVIAIIVIYLIYLLFKHVIIPLIVVLAPIVFWTTIAGAFIVSIVNYIRSFSENINPYNTYIDKNPNKPEGAGRNYFFGPGQHQIGMIVKGAWSNNKNTITWIWNKVGNIDSFFLKIVPFILAVIATVVIAIMGSLWTVVFSVIHFVILFPFIIIFRILFGVLALIDRLVLAVNSISARCPDCKKRSVIPDFFCPQCGAIHKHLVPGHYGIFYRKCSCGKMLPSTFLNGRSKLEAHCPYCDHVLPTSNARNFAIQLVGGTKSGKTTFLASFLHEYREEIKKNKRIGVKLHPETEFDEMERWYSQGFAESTSAMNANTYSIVHTWKRSQFSHQFSIYDIAGEVFSSESASRKQEQYRYCEGLIVVADPFSSRSVRLLYENKHEGKSPLNFSPMDMQDVVDGFINEFSRIGVLSTGKMSDKPVSVIISKADVDVVKHEIGYDKINSVFQANSQKYKSKDDARDAICRDYLCQIGMAGVVNNLAAQFSKIHYFPVSAMGHEDDKSAYDPWGIMEPVMWIIKKKDQRLLDILEPGKKLIKDVVRGIAAAAIISLILIGGINFYTAHKEFISRKNAAIHEYVSGKMGGLYSITVGKIAENIKRAVEERAIKAVEEKTDSVFIQSGTFTMGSPASEEGRKRDEIQHEVTVSSFYMGKHEVTQQEYQRLMGNNPSRNKGDYLPVEQISWYDAVAYCNAKSLAEGLTPAYMINGKDITWDKSADGYRLPTEAEWEYACRAGSTTAYSFGANITSSQAKHGANSGGSVTVGSYMPNAKGLYDMHGNVWEWCWDRYGDYPGEAQTGPSGPSSGANRVNRGGGWASKEGYILRSANRDFDSPDHQSAYLGFRVARTYGIASVAVTPASSFVSIPGGTFAMGSPDSETGRDKDEGPVHRVTLSGFDMGRYEVTQKEYKALMGKNPSLFKAMPILSSNRPVESVTWYDAVAFCNAKSLAEGLTPAYTINGEDVTWDKSADGYRLPTEAEWEYACRAGTTTAYNSGSRIGSAKYGETKGGPVNVGSYAPNAWGLYDMHGNVYEWCWDWMGDYSSRAQTDPAGSLSGSTRVRRSGSWNASGQYLRSANRGAYSPSDQDGGIGFRLVRSAK